MKRSDISKWAALDMDAFRWTLLVVAVVTVCLLFALSVQRPQVPPRCPDSHVFEIKMLARLCVEMAPDRHVDQAWCSALALSHYCPFSRDASGDE